jgi:hypothetical protein
VWRKVRLDPFMPYTWVNSNGLNCQINKIGFTLFKFKKWVNSLSHENEIWKNSNFKEDNFDY